MGSSGVEAQVTFAVVLSEIQLIFDLESEIFEEDNKQRIQTPNKERIDTPAPSTTITTTEYSSILRISEEEVMQHRDDDRTNNRRAASQATKEKNAAISISAPTVYLAGTRSFWDDIEQVVVHAITQRRSYRQHGCVE